jgi:4-alpha-glucanotransferase
MNLSPENKIAGVLAPLFALRRDGDLGVGDVETLRDFIDWVAGSGFKLVQLLPINETGGDNSPYNAISAMAIEPTTLHLAPGSPEELSGFDFDCALEDTDVDKLRRGSVKYAAVKAFKRQLFEKAFARFVEEASENRQSRFQKFCAEEADWLDDYALFRALMEENGESERWDKWPEEQGTIEKARKWVEGLSEDRSAQFKRRQDFFCYVQWIARDQWRETRRFAHERGVALMGDIPFGVSYYSADVFARPDEFVLDWCGGAPPEPYFKDDEFTQKWGQNWGIPIYQWSVMRAKDFSWWRHRIRSVKQIFDLFRIDHVLGFYRIYAFPWRPKRNKEFLPLDQYEMLQETGGHGPHFSPRDDSTWENCAANQREGEEYLRVVLEESGATRVIGEDLGTVPDYVRPHQRSLGIAGFKIPQWEYYNGRVVPGAEYERFSVATYATHDHKPIFGLWDEVFEQATSTSDQARFELEKIATFAGTNLSNETNFEDEFYPAMMKALFQSESWLSIVMITDLLIRKYRFNVPGTAAGSNWTRRMKRTIAQLHRSPLTRKRMLMIRELLEQSGRI